jgi:hypothetical protein
LERVFLWSLTSCSMLTNQRTICISFKTFLPYLTAGSHPYSWDPLPSWPLRQHALPLFIIPFFSPGLLQGSFSYFIVIS